MRYMGLLLLILFSFLSCSGGNHISDSIPESSDTGNCEHPDSRYIPEQQATWQWQLSGPVNTSYNADLYDIDLFDSSRQLILDLHLAGKKVICYFSAGSYERWRPDAARFDDQDLGNTLDEWPGEKWLDIRSDRVRLIMLVRLDLAKEKGCDCVEPDNVDGYSNSSGFPITAEDQLDFNRFLALEAHQRNLSVGLKNDLDQIDDLVDVFDFAVNEQCFEFSECNALTPFTDNGKAVLHVEYKDVYRTNPAERNQLCEDAVNRKFSTLILPLDLDDQFRFSCE